VSTTAVRRTPRARRSRLDLRRSLAILRKDLSLGPRSPIFLWTLVMPIVMTLLVQGVFGSLFERQPRLGLVDAGGSELAAVLAATPGLDLRVVADAAELKRQVAAHDLDGGLVLPAGFDAAVRAGSRPLLEMYVAGESLASDRMVLSVTTIDALRAIDGRSAPVDVQVVATGDGDALSIAQRLVPLLVLMALLVAGVFLTSFSLVEERERGTLAALLVTPATLPEVLLAKGALGAILGLLMASATLALNGVLVAGQVALLLALLVGAVMAVEIGLLYGTLARDTKTLYTLIKSLNLILVGPVIFYLFPDWPQWIARVFPTFWFLDPIFRVSMSGAGLADVGGDLLVGAAICLALVPVILTTARRAERRTVGA
jgi:ABC-2 type transport system permease protein